MAQTGFTPIKSYSSSTASAAPLAANLLEGELAVNVTDQKLYTKNSSGTVIQVSDPAVLTTAAASKATPVDADTIPLVDSAASNVLKKLTWANLKATLSTWLTSILAAPPPIGGTTPNAGTFTTLAATGNVTLGDADTDTTTINGVATVSNTGRLDIGTAGSSIYRRTSLDGSLVIHSATANLELQASGGNIVLIGSTGAVVLPSTLTATAINADNAITATSQGGTAVAGTATVSGFGISGDALTGFGGYFSSTNGPAIALGAVAAEPTTSVTDGSIYYNSASKKFMGYANGGWSPLNLADINGDISNIYNITARGPNFNFGTSGLTGILSLSGGNTIGGEGSVIRFKNGSGATEVLAIGNTSAVDSSGPYSGVARIKYTTLGMTFGPSAGTSHITINGLSGAVTLSNSLSATGSISTGNTVLATGKVYASTGTAIPAGGSANDGFCFSSTNNFGVFFGAGAPTMEAAKGSLYLRSDGSSTSTRIYVNTNGLSGWTNLITAA